MYNTQSTFLPLYYDLGTFQNRSQYRIISKIEIPLGVLSYFKFYGPETLTLIDGLDVFREGIQMCW